MTERNMQHQAAVHGGASATYGYSPASEAPPPATRLLDLPPALLDDIACRVMQLQARGGTLSLTCRAFSKANLLHAPALHIQLESQRRDRLLTPRVVAALKARTCKLALTLEQQQFQDSRQYIRLLTEVLKKLASCSAVVVCKLCTRKGPSLYRDERCKRLSCSPDLAQHLMDSFPSLTSLSLHNYAIPCSDLASLLSHPPLALQLQQLDLSSTTILQPEQPEPAVPAIAQLSPQLSLQLQQLDLSSTIITHAEQPEPGAATLSNLFHASRLKQLSLLISGMAPLPNLQPLSQHLTQLCLMLQSGVGLDEFTAPLQPLAQLQVLTISDIYRVEGLPGLLQVLPRLHTLQLPDANVRKQEQLDILLAATQLTSIQLGCLDGLTSSRADVPCSWQRLELIERVGWKAITYLPLHSLSQPLVLGKLDISVRDIPDPEMAAALHLLAEAITVPVHIWQLVLKMRSDDSVRVTTPALLQQQRVDLAQLVALLQPLQCCGKVEVSGLHEVTAADVLALAPLCRDCAHFVLSGGSVKPSLEFWHQLVQLMPAVQEVEFTHVEGCVSAAMHESLQLMAQQPWARWLDITLQDHRTAPKPPAYWRSVSWVKANVFKVTVLGM
ncbi:hypothetical protein QJQ45_006644 [Haematococcus lacustris]|nr:hypothetical protein QJQ45_006644 [Haematococcus lacustris]